MKNKNDLHLMLELAGISSKISDFAKKRGKGAKDIAEKSHEKGGLALLTYEHFSVKLPYYDKASDGKFEYKKALEEYKKLCSSLLEQNIETIKQEDYQKLVGKIEVLGELLIEYRDKK